MSRFRRLLRASAVLSTACLLVAACGDDDDSSGAVTTAAPATSAAQPSDDEPRRGGTVTWIHNDEPRGLRPWEFTMTPNLDGQHALALYDALILETYDGELEYRIAESMESSDARVWTLTLRDGVKFTDGTPYDAEAVKYTWEQIARPENRSSNAASAQLIESMQVVDPLHLRITLKQKDSQFPRTVAAKLNGIASPTALRDPSIDFNAKPVGAGPFVLERWVRGSQMRLTRNPTYWDAPRPYVDALEFRQLDDCQQQVNQLATTENSYATSNTCAGLIVNAERQGFETEKFVPAVGALGLLFNMARPPFDDLRARQAFVQALDWKRHAEVVGLGVGLQMEYIARPGTKWHDPQARQLQYNPEAAQRLFDELAAEKGGPVRFGISGTLNIQQSVDLWVSQFSAYRNVEVSSDVTQSADYSQKLGRRDIDVGVSSAFGPDPIPQFGDTFATGSARNWASYSNPDVDAAIRTLREELDEQARIRAFSTMQRRLVEDIPMYFYIERPLYFAYHDSLRDLGVTTMGNRFDKMWIAE